MTFHAFFRSLVVMASLARKKTPDEDRCTRYARGSVARWKCWPVGNSLLHSSWWNFRRAGLKESGSLPAGVSE
jgi:hypothetical protein